MKNTKLKILNSLASLGVTLEDLYKQETAQINIHLSDKGYWFHVVLKTHSEVDCKISSFAANLWARTNKGMKYQKYKSLSTLQSSLVRLIEEKVDTIGDITFSINKECYSF